MATSDKELPFAADGERAEVERPLTPAEQKLVVSHLAWAKGVVKRLAARYSRVLDPKDSEQMASEALSRAARGYDRTRGVPFAGFAVKPVRGAVQHGARGERRFHDSLVTGCEDWREEGDLLEETDEEARDRLHALAEQGAAAAVVGGLGMATRALAAGGEDGIFREMGRKHVRDALASLPERPREVIERRQFSGQEVKEVASALGVSEVTVRRDYEAGLKKLRRRLAKADVEP